MIYADYEYEEVALGSCLDLAMKLTGAQKKWHSHVLSPHCVLNPYPEQFAIVIEDDTDGVSYIAASDGFPEVDRELVKMLHGDDILDEAKSRLGGADVSIDSELLARVVELNDRGVPWHHHMNFPDCVFNQRKGKWAITVESGTGDIAYETYDHEPKEILREIEVLYFRNL
jgi:hypothetical protein